MIKINATSTNAWRLRILDLPKQKRQTAERTTTATTNTTTSEVENKIKAGNIETELIWGKSLKIL